MGLEYVAFCVVSLLILHIGCYLAEKWLGPINALNESREIENGEADSFVNAAMFQDME